MNQQTTDPLLTSARVILAILVGLIAFSLVLLGIGLVAALSVQRAEILEQIADAGLSSENYWGVMAGLVAVLAVLYVGLRFVLLLRQVVASVDRGDPFISENATRLSKMGWLALIMQGLSFGLLSAARALQEIAPVDTQLRFDGSGLALVLTLFILARVFRRGAEMRDDLAGTV